MVELNDGTQIIFPLDTIQEIINYTICLPPSCSYELSFSGFINQPDLNIYNAFLIYNGFGGNFYYNSSYTINTSCGCTDPTAVNYDITANVDDGSCIEAILGCTDPLAINYDNTANFNDGSCVYYGCTDSLSFNYNPNAVIDDGSCIPFIYGCTDSTALNYNQSANSDDGSCYDCATNINIFTSNPSSASSCDGYILITTPNTINYLNWSDNSIGLFNNNLCNDIFSFTVIDNNGCGYSETILLSDYLGCTEINSINYDNAAVFDDCSCIPIIYGCTDLKSFNYDRQANTDDGSCIDIIYGCMDSSATNYDINANVDLGSCTYCYANADILTNF